MDEVSLAIRINSRFQDLAHLRGYSDLDSFGLRFAEMTGRLAKSGLPLQDSVRKAIAETTSAFFRVNGVNRGALADELTSNLSDVAHQLTLQDHILAFKRFAERQLVSVLRKQRDEETFRSLLQTHLNRDFLTYREVESGGGRSDILVIEPYKELVEAKVWSGPAYFDDGLTETAAYLDSEVLSRGHYVIVEFGAAANFIESQGSDTWTEERDGKEISVVFVRIPAVSPSKRGRTSRKESRGE